MQVATAQLQVRKADLDVETAMHRIEQLQDELQVRTPQHAHLYCRIRHSSTTPPESLHVISQSIN